GHRHLDLPHRRRRDPPLRGDGRHLGSRAVDGRRHPDGGRRHRPAALHPRDDDVGRPRQPRRPHGGPRPLRGSRGPALL
ncbi:MAG: hypothetical protein AVDCRST_MAG13-1721, partial [uncultured Solirubrobacteraceae bacterium]